MPAGSGTFTDPQKLPLGAAAGGDLAGTYPNPNVADASVVTGKIGNQQVTGPKLASGLTPLYLLYDNTLGANTPGPIDTGANGIAQTGTHLLIYITARTDEVAVSSSLVLRFNGDSGANYDSQRISDLNVTVTGVLTAAATSIGLLAAGGLANAGEAGVTTIFIPGYTGTTYHKVVTGITSFLNNTAGNVVLRLQGMRWRSTAAITQLSLTRGGGSNISAGTRVQVFAM